MAHPRLIALALAGLVPTCAILFAGGTGARGQDPAADEPAELRPITVLCVRHAEKAADGGADPGLTEEGRERALALARLLRDAGITHLLATEYVRTRATLAPLAAELGLEIEVRYARDPLGTAADILSLPGGSKVVVAGHSNTIPAIVRALGGDPLVSELDEGCYDRLYVVTVPRDGGCAVATLELRFGGP